VLAEPAIAGADIPPVDLASFDGIALRAEETAGAGSYNPLRFRLVEAGKALPPFGAVRVKAGEPLPEGADAVAAMEHASFDEAGGCDIIEPVAAGSQVEQAGSHAARGVTLLAAGLRLSPYDIGLLASAGIERISVIRRPKVRIVVMGHGRGDAEALLLRALIERDGGKVAELCVIVGRDGLRDLLTARGADIVLVAGSAVQDMADEAAALLAETGELPIRGIAVHPGESTGLGRTGDGIPVVLLPAAPAVACLWAYEFFAGRAIRRLAERNPALPFPSRRMRTRRKIVSIIGITDVWPVRCLGGESVEPIASFAEAGLVAAAQADGFIIVPEGSEGFSEGTTVTVYLKMENREPLDPISGSLAPRH
jgi:molybdopterin molybdotransferase